MLTLGSISIETAPAGRRAIQPEGSLGKLGPDHTPRPRSWPAAAVLTTIHAAGSPHDTESARFHPDREESVDRLSDIVVRAAVPKLQKRKFGRSSIVARYEGFGTAGARRIGRRQAWRALKLPRSR